jgi:chemotaxis protein CheX
MINAEFINPFLEAATGIFKSVLNADLRRGRVQIKEQTNPTHKVAIIIGITGDASGQVVFNMSEDAAIKIARHLSPQMSPSELRVEFPDIIGEIANMVVGNAMNLFTSKGTSLDMTPPSVITGQNISVKFIRQTTLGINLYSLFGPLEVNIALK